jgi:hypothetical protein
MITIFGEKIGVLLKYQCYDQLFSKNFFVLSQKRHFFAKIFGENISKIITSVPDQIWGQCYDLYFRRFSPIFGEKVAILLKPRFWNFSQN